MAKVAGVPPRHVQYLREVDVVRPAFEGKGRGDFCWYSVNDVVMVYLCLVELSELSYELRRTVVKNVSWRTVGTHEIMVSGNCKLHVDMGRLRHTVEWRINNLVDSDEV